VSNLTGRIAAVGDATARMARRPRVAFLEWLDPIFGGGHWNPELVRLAGGVDPLGREGRAAVTMSWDDVVAMRPELLFVACCGYDVERTLDDLAPFAERDGWEGLPAVQTGRIHVADGTRFFSRPGPGLVDSLEMLAHAIAPDAHAPPRDVAPARRVRPQELRARGSGRAHAAAAHQ
jgi:iron complex transport system substrate-binding protein